MAIDIPQPSRYIPVERSIDHNYGNRNSLQKTLQMLGLQNGDKTAQREDFRNFGLLQQDSEQASNEISYTGQQGLMNTAIREANIPGARFERRKRLENLTEESFRDHRIFVMNNPNCVTHPQDDPEAVELVYKEGKIFRGDKNTPIDTNQIKPILYFPKEFIQSSSDNTAKNTILFHQPKPEKPVPNLSDPRLLRIPDYISNSNQPKNAEVSYTLDQLKNYLLNVKRGVKNIESLQVKLNRRSAILFLKDGDKNGNGIEINLAQTSYKEVAGLCTQLRITSDIYYAK